MQRERWKRKVVFNKKCSEASAIAKSSLGRTEAACEPSAWRGKKSSHDGQGSLYHPWASPSVYRASPLLASDESWNVLAALTSF